MTARDLDQFYTNPTVAVDCLSKVTELYDLSDFDIVFEPCAGAGSFFNIFPAEQREGVDLEPKVNGVEKMNFLHYLPDLSKTYIAISNPPFGKNAGLAVKFFNKAATFCDVIAFIVPRTFNKKRLQNRLDNKFHLVYDEVLKDDAFIFQGESYDVPTTFQIWERRRENRPQHLIQTRVEDFQFTTKELASFAIQRVGGRAGLIRPKDDMLQYSSQSHYFILPKTDLVLEVFKTIDFTHVKYNTAGNPSVSPGELVELYQLAKDKLTEEVADK